MPNWKTLERFSGKERHTRCTKNNVLCKSEYAEVDWHLLERSLVALPLQCVMKTNEKVALDCQINGSLDENNDHEKTACKGVWQNLRQEQLRDTMGSMYARREPFSSTDECLLAGLWTVVVDMQRTYVQTHRRILSTWNSSAAAVGVNWRT